MEFQLGSIEQTHNARSQYLVCNYELINVFSAQLLLTTNIPNCSSQPNEYIQMMRKGHHRQDDVIFSNKLINYLSPVFVITKPNYGPWYFSK